LKHPITWAQIDLDAYAHNIKELKRITRPPACLMAVVKANAYGHGAVEISRRALQNGASRLGVARINEAVALREAGISAPILVLGYSPPQLAETLVEFDLTQTVYRYDSAQRLADRARRLGHKIKVHVKVDSGMGRLGFVLLPTAMETAGEDPVDDCRRQILSIARLSGLEMEGLFTHFATADSADKSYAREQLQRFGDLVDRLENAGLRPALIHAANSAALIDMPEAHFDMVRPGIATYGLYPSAEVDQEAVDLRPVMALKSRIIHLKKVPAGFYVSYGITHCTPRPTIIATVPVGYADGYSRLLSSRGRMLVHGQRVPVVGRVCMDLTMLDVGSLSGVQLEDEVVVFGQQADAAITADELASRLKTINYEIVAAITARVPRVYIQ